MKQDFKQSLLYISGIKDSSKRREQYNQLKYDYFTKFDHLLNMDKDNICNLSSPDIGAIIKESLFYRDGNVFDLVAFTIMPNHLHLVFYPIVGRIANSSNINSPYVISKIMQSLKRHKARKINTLLNRTGNLWQHENYDHFVRDGKSLNTIVEYILNNPVKARLIDDADKWEWNYCNPNFF